MSYQSGSSTINGDVNAVPGLPTPGTGQTPINYRVACNGSSQDIHTVTAGKTFYLVGVVYYSTGAAATACQLTTYANNGTTIRLQQGFTQATTALTTNAVISSLSPIASWAAGEVVKMTGTNGTAAAVWGYEA